MKNFKVVQSIRLAMIVTLTVTWFMCFYILVRQILFYLSFYAASIQLAAHITLSICCGRLVVEQKMLSKLNNEKLSNYRRMNKAFLPQDRISELPEEDRSTMWRPAIMLYTVSTPFVWMSLILFYATDMQHDILCVLAKLGNSGQDFDEEVCS